MHWEKLTAKLTAYSHILFHQTPASTAILKSIPFPLSSTNVSHALWITVTFHRTTPPHHPPSFADSWAQKYKALIPDTMLLTDVLHIQADHHLYCALQACSNPEACNSRRDLTCIAYPSVCLLHVSLWIQTAQYLLHASLSLNLSPSPPNVSYHGHFPTYPLLFLPLPCLFCLQLWIAPACCLCQTSLYAGMLHWVHWERKSERLQ